MKKLLFFTFVCISAQLFATDYSISLYMKGFAKQKVLVAKVTGDMSALIDTLESDFTGTIKTHFSDSYSQGMYKFIFPQLKNAEVAFIFNYENISLESEATSPENFVKVLLSKENEMHYGFLNHIKKYQNTIETLEYVNENYNGVDYVKQTNLEYQRVIQEFNAANVKFLEMSKGMYVNHIIASTIPVVPPTLLNTFKKNVYLQNHFFDNLQFADTVLFTTEIFTNACIQYLTIMTSQYKAGNKNTVFLQAVDTILKKTKPYPATFDFVVDYLLNGFESMGAVEIVSYISNVYLQTNSCEGSHKTTLERKAVSNVHLAIGKPIPDFKIATQKNNTLSKKDCMKGNFVFVFWATWCTHCADFVPLIAAEYAILNKPNYELVTIALDTNKVAWNDFLMQNPGFNKTLNTRDILGWDGETAKAFNIYATPTIFMVTDGIIVARPIELDDYKKQLQKLGFK